jgi:outer membrane protein OmpU
VGLTALAGSLASFTAYAGEVTISGGAEMTWTTKHKDTTGDGNPLGLKKSMTFSYSGELDNGYTWAGHTALADSATGDVFGGLTSAGLAITMGDMGTLTWGQTMTSALGAIDDVMPTAWEETWNGQATAPTKVGQAQAGTHIDYNSPDYNGTTFEIAWNPDAGASLSGGGSASDGSGSAWDIAFASNLGGVEGLTIGGGYGELERLTNTSTGGYAHDSWEAAAYVKYAIGPVTLGYQETAEDSGHGSAVAADYYENKHWGVSFLVNDNFSISYGEFDSNKHWNNEATADIEASYDAINASYTMGAMSIRYQESSCAA